MTKYSQSWGKNKVYSLLLVFGLLCEHVSELKVAGLVKQNFESDINRYFKYE